MSVFLTHTLQTGRGGATPLPRRLSCGSSDGCSRAFSGGEAGNPALRSDGAERAGSFLQDAPSDRSGGSDLRLLPGGSSRLLLERGGLSCVPLLLSASPAVCLSCCLPLPLPASPVTCPSCCLPLLLLVPPVASLSCCLPHPDRAESLRPRRFRRPDRLLRAADASLGVDELVELVAAADDTRRADGAELALPHLARRRAVGTVQLLEPLFGHARRGAEEEDLVAHGHG